MISINTPISRRFFNLIPNLLPAYRPRPRTKRTKNKKKTINIQQSIFTNGDLHRASAYGVRRPRTRAITLCYRVLIFSRSRTR